MAETVWVRWKESGTLEEIGTMRLEEVGDQVTEVDAPMLQEGNVRYEERDDGWYAITDTGEQFGPYKSSGTAANAMTQRGVQE